MTEKISCCSCNHKIIAVAVTSIITTIVVGSAFSIMVLFTKNNFGLRYLFGRVKKEGYIIAQALYIIMINGTIFAVTFGSLTMGSQLCLCLANVKKNKLIKKIQPVHELLKRLKNKHKQYDKEINEFLMCIGLLKNAEEPHITYEGVYYPEESVWNKLPSDSRIFESFFNAITLCFDRGLQKSSDSDQLQNCNSFKEIFDFILLYRLTDEDIITVTKKLEECCKKNTLKIAFIYNIYSLSINSDVCLAKGNFMPITTSNPAFNPNLNTLTKQLALLIFCHNFHKKFSYKFSS